MNDDHLPYPDDETEDIPPDAVSGEKRPVSPDEAVRREQQKYGESGLDENRDDQQDAHHATPDDVV